ncbi:hypothetical protein L7F22_031574 [Adiantum nelumboides]|nr:hypothetical protein [Adiantum nelumboides]
MVHCGPRLLLVLLIGVGACHAWSFSPLHPKDLLPALPHHLAWPILNTFSSAVDLLPQFVSNVGPTQQQNSSSWQGACFSENHAFMEYTENGGVLHIQTQKPVSWTCMDLYIFATSRRLTWDYYYVARNHTMQFDQWEEGELDYVKQHGVSVFLMPAGMLGTVESLWDVLPLFSNTGWGENSNIAFLEKHMGTKLVKRTGPLVTNFSADDIRSGDFLALSKIRGRWGGFETLEKWVTGAYAGHTAVCLRDESNQLWVGESGHENEKGEEIIALLPWNEWWQIQLDDVAHAHVALLPLHPDMRARFNASAAFAFARQMKGKPYGYHNMIFSWIDTAIDNYPPPLDAHVVMSLMTMWTRVQPAYAANMWNEALNKRLGTEGLDLPSVLMASEEMGISFDELLAMPEDDEWIYSDGKSASCVAFVLAMYKAAGLFGPLSDAVQVTEFTIRDAYMLKFYEDDKSRLPAWCSGKSGDDLPYCQLLGEYLMEFPGYNTIEPYAQMNEKCPSLAPDYFRPDLC